MRSVSCAFDYATESAIEKAIETGTEAPISTSMFLHALRDMKPSTRPWLELARNYARYGNESGVYDDLRDYLHKEGIL